MIELKLDASMFEQVANELKQIPDIAEILTHDVAVMLRDRVYSRTPEDTGDLKKSWSQVQHTAGGFSFSNEQPYAYVVEEGRYKGLGPKTERQGDGIYSSSAPGGMITPIVSDKELLKKVVSSVLKEIVKDI
jgi:hypothetical protein